MTLMINLIKLIW